MKALRVVCWVIQVILSACYTGAHDHEPKPILQPPYIIYPANHVQETFVVLKNEPLTINVIQYGCWRNAKSDHHHHQHHEGHRRKEDIPTLNIEPGHGFIHQDHTEDYKANCHTAYENILAVNATISTDCIREHQHTYIKIPADEVNGDISNLMTCSLFDNVDNTLFTVKFMLKVKAGRRVHVDLNGQELKFTEIHQTHNYYDGEYWYRFVEGENITLQCSNIYQIGNVKLQYYKKGILMYSTSERYAKQSLKFQQQMASTHSGSYVDCIYEKDFKEYPQAFVYRTMFLKDFFLLHVNNLNTTQMSQRIENGKFIYIYKYVKGEQVLFTCEKVNRNLHGQIKIVYDAKTTRFAQEIESLEWRKTVSLNTEDLDGGRIYCNFSKFYSHSIQFVQDSSRDHNTTVIVMCALIPVVAIIVTLCAVYWCRRTSSITSEQILNESFSQCRTPRFPRQMSNTDDCDYTYIENEYNYISESESGYMRPNSLYQAEKGSVVPRVRLSASGNQTDKNDSDVYARYTAACNINTGSPTYPGSSKHEPTTNNMKYENLHNVSKQQDEMNNVNYSYPQQKHTSLNNKTFEKNNIYNDINFLKEHNIIRYSNLLKDNNIAQRENDK